MRKKKAAAAPNFTGDLATPITLPAHLDPATMELLPAAVERRNQEIRTIIATETLRKVTLLAKHYGLDSDDLDTAAWPLLLKVCHDLIPGFNWSVKEPSKRRRPVEWDASRMALLVYDVERTRAAKKCNQRAALLHLIMTNEKYKPTSGIPRADDSKKRAIDSLETRLGEAKHGPFAPLIANLRARGVEDVIFDMLGATEIH